MNNSFLQIQACFFDLDGLLINSEDITTLYTNELLRKYDRPPFTWSIRAQLMGVPNATTGDVFYNWAKLPIPREQFDLELDEQKRLHFPNCMPIPGAEKLLSNLSHAGPTSSGQKIQLALASSSMSKSYELKTTRSETKQLLNAFRTDRRILGDDPRIQHGRGKPAPDIYLAALDSVNATADCYEHTITPEECLVFEDSVAGVEAGRRAGMHVIWVPHPELAAEYRGKQKDVLAERTGIVDIGDSGQLGEIDNGWIEVLPSLESFNYRKYGINISP
jgi:pseudouridine 5'-phosphatase